MNARVCLKRTAMAALVLAAAALVCACGRANGKAPKARKAVPVMVAEARVMSVPVLVQAVGNVEAFASVSIKPQVSGVIAKQLVRDGQDVVKDQTLFVIDPRTYHAALQEAQARLQKDVAQAKKAEDDLKRYQTLFEQGAVSRDQLDQMHTNAMTLRAALDLDRAQVEQARVQLGHATIKAPISGRAGHVLVQEGNVVGKSGDDRVLLVINQLTPISVSFAVPEDHLPEIQRQWAQGPLHVEARSGQGDLLDTGLLASIDNAVDKTTGTIRLKATFQNAQRQLWPGQFVRASLRLSERERAVVIPAHAVQTGMHGPFVFVVRDDLSVDMREVVTSPGGEGTLVADKGVAPGERVVTDGQVMLVPGSLVEIRPQPDEGGGRQTAKGPDRQPDSAPADSAPAQRIPVGPAPVSPSPAPAGEPGQGNAAPAPAAQGPRL